MKDHIRKEVEKIVGHYCDGTIDWGGDEPVFSLKNGNLIEYFTDEVTGPQTLADELIEFILSLDGIPA